MTDKAQSCFNKSEQASGTDPAKIPDKIAGLLQFSWTPVWLSALVLMGLVIAAYLPVWHASFIWDDDTFLINNPLIRQAEGLYQFWFTTKAPDYFPMTSTTLWLEWRLWGNNPLGYHIVNLFLHALSTVLLWRVLAHLKIPGSWLAAALFAVHPVNVESVAWITQRKNTLAMLFYVTSILFYLRFEDTDRWRWYGMALGSFIVALLSKTAVVPLPIVLLGLAWWRRNHISRRDILCTLPFFGVSVLSGLLTIWFQSHNAIGSDVVRTDDLWSRLAGAGFTVWFYLYKALIPVNLVFVYPKWEIDATKLLSYVPGLLVPVIAFVFWRYRRGWGRAWLLGWGYFVVMLIPVMGFWNIYFMRYSLVADHWQYFSIIGPIGLAAAGITRMHDRLKQNIFLVPVVSVTLLLILGVLTWRQTGNYSDIETLWKKTIAGNPDCWMAYNNYGILLREQGQFDKAIIHYQEAIRLKPDYTEAYYNRGNIYLSLGQYQNAVNDFDKTIDLDPGFFQAYNEKGIVYERLKDYKSAIENFNTAILLKPDYATAYYNRGNAYLSLGQYPNAIENYNQALLLKPDYIKAYNNRGVAYLIQGNDKLGCPDVKKACELGSCELLEGAMNEGICR